MIRENIYALAVCFAFFYALSYFVTEIVPAPLLWYYPLERRWDFAVEAVGLAMDWYGRCLLSAAVGLAASDLWELRTGRRQKVGLETRRATASLRSGHYLVMEGAPVSAARHTIMGVYPAKHGRWSYLHCNFPNHREAALKVLGVPEDREAVRKAVAQWDAAELEEAIIAAKGAGGMVRTMQEWAEHPQGNAVENWWTESALEASQ